MVDATASTRCIGTRLGDTVDGTSFPLEAYFVHQLDDVALHGTYHRFAVISLLYELGECNRSRDNFWSEFPEMKARISIPGSHLERILSISLKI